MTSLSDEIKKNQETAIGNFGGYNADVLDLEPIHTDTCYTDATIDALIGIVLEANPGRGISFIANMYIRPYLVPFDAARDAITTFEMHVKRTQRSMQAKMETGDEFLPVRNISE
ncbi:MAG: Uncharacterized protein AUREO_024600 [Aureobasidium pullulans]|nr:MAG: Uncharacterized protein AUREO_024600 [Aureobasidium pullulans]